MSELFVKCDGDQECANGSWLHPQCTTDLRLKSKAELDSMEEWYCEDCVARIKREDEGLPEEEEDLEMDEGDIEVNIDEQDDNEGDNDVDENMNEEEEDAAFADDI